MFTVNFETAAFVTGVARERRHKFNYKNGFFTCFLSHYTSVSLSLEKPSCANTSFREGLDNMICGHIPTAD